MKFKYESLEIWQLSLKLIKLIYQLIKTFPPEERFELSSQARRAVTSIALNIAEGSGRQTKKDFACFVNRSTTSLQEVDAILKVAICLNFFAKTNEIYCQADPLIEKLYFKSIAFRKHLLVQ